MEAEARRLFDRLGTPISPRARVGDLRIGDQQMVEIAKALAFDAAILIMDEPTSALSDAEVARLFRVIDDLRRAGSTILYISHKMNEVFALADRVTVLRDGRFVVSAVDRAETEPAQVVRWMVGREIAEMAFDDHAVAGKALLQVEGLSLPSPPDSGRPALAGPALRGPRRRGAGHRRPARRGADRAARGPLRRHPGRAVGDDRARRPARPLPPPAEAIAAGVALVTEDRKTLGLFDQMTVAENITICHLDALARAGLIDRRAEAAAVAELDRSARRSRPPAAAPSITSLSGGNQQKCILARWLLTEPKVLLLDEPTRGIDVGAKAEIYVLIRRLAEAGHGDRHDLQRAARAPDRLRPDPRPLRRPAHRRAPPRRGHRRGDHACGDPVPRPRDRDGVSARRGDGPVGLGRSFREVAAELLGSTLPIGRFPLCDGNPKTAPTERRDLRHRVGYGLTVGGPG